MGLIATDKGGTDFEPTPEGVHLGVCYGVVDLGHQFNDKYQNFNHKVLIQWELPNERIDVEDSGVTVSKPRAISRRFTLSLSEKSHLRPLLESWRSKKFTPMELVGFDIQNLIGANCQIQVLHNENNGKTYANVHAVMPILKGTEKLEPENPTIYYSIEDMGLNIPEGIPEWIVKIIQKSQEFDDHGEEHGQGGYYPDDHGSEEPPTHGYEDSEPVPF